MLWSGSAPVKLVRDSTWGFLMFAGAAWLAIAWTVLRLEPANVVAVAGPVLLFGALCEAVRALAGTKTWWLNAGMAVLIAATGVILLTNRDSTYTTPESLIGWYLMVRGTLDIGVSIMNRGVDRTWALILTLGVTQTALGFYAAGPLSRGADPVVVTLGALGTLRAIADLTTSLRLREVAHAHDVLRLSPEREAGVAGYSAGLSDYPATQSQSRGAKHRADQVASATRPTADGTWAATTDVDGTKPGGAKADGATAGTVHADAVTPGGAHADGKHDDNKHDGKHDAGKHDPGKQGAGKQGDATHDDGAHAADGVHADATHASAPSPSFHDEVLRTTADLDTRIAQAGVTGTGTAQRVTETLPPVPDTPEGVTATASTAYEQAAVVGDDH